MTKKKSENFFFTKNLGLFFFFGEILSVLYFSNHTKRSSATGQCPLITWFVLHSKLKKWVCLDCRAFSSYSKNQMKKIASENVSRYILYFARCIGFGSAVTYLYNFLSCYSSLPNKRTSRISVQGTLVNW